MYLEEQIVFNMSKTFEGNRNNFIDRSTTWDELSSSRLAINYYTLRRTI